MEYAKLSKFNGEGSVKLWGQMAEECIAIRKLVKEEAASFMLYHIEGDAKMEVMMMCGDVTSTTKIMETLEERYLSETSLNEVIYRIMARKQLEGESNVEYMAEMLKLGWILKDMTSEWEGTVMESVRKNVNSIDLRRSLQMSKGGIKSFRELRKVIVDWEIETKEDENCYEMRESRLERICDYCGRDGHTKAFCWRAPTRNTRGVDRGTNNISGSSNYMQRKEGMSGVRHIEMGNENVRRRVCFQCGKEGHIRRFCRSNLNYNGPQ